MPMVTTFSYGFARSAPSVKNLYKVALLVAQLHVESSPFTPPVPIFVHSCVARTMGSVCDEPMTMPYASASGWFRASSMLNMAFHMAGHR